MKNNHRFRIIYKPGEKYPYFVEKKVFFFWVGQTMHANEFQAREQILEFLRQAHADVKPWVVAEYSSEDYLVDKLKGQ